MKNCTKQEVGYLKELGEINECRINGYKNAITKVFDDKFLRFFSENIKKSNELNTQLCHLVDEALKDFTSNEDNIKTSCIKYYFTLAKLSSNARTVILSCYLGDISSVKIYKSLLCSVNFTFGLKELLSKQLAYVEETQVIAKKILLNSK